MRKNIITYKSDEYYYYDFKNTTYGDFVKGITKEMYEFVQSLEPWINLHPAFPIDGMQYCENIKDKHPFHDPFERLKCNKCNVIITFKLCSDDSILVFFSDAKWDPFVKSE